MNEEYEKRLDLALDCSKDPQTIEVTNHTSDTILMNKWRLNSPLDDLDSFIFPWSKLHSGQSMTVWCSEERPAYHSGAVYWWKGAHRLFGEDPIEVTLQSEHGSVKSKVNLVGLKRSPPSPSPPPSPAPVLCQLTCHLHLSDCSVSGWADAITCPIV